MKNFILNNGSTNPNAAADTPQPQTPVAPDVAIEQIRSLRAQLPAATTLTVKQRKGLRNSSETSEPIVQASLNVIGVSDIVSMAVGMPLDNVRALQQDAILWKAVEEEARNLVTGLAGANALRRQKLAELGQQALQHRYAAAGSLYLLRDEARYDWMHTLDGNRDERYSITFRA
ncbi:MAG TPA: hypothetical protein VGJ81_22900 [Thermoanaerobaculia bacterium]|jgi:hypothetical protein